MCRKKLFVGGAAIVIVMATVMFFPVTGTAGSSNPPTPPILDQLPPTWSQKIDSFKRFELVLDDAAVLDKETGLVWERDASGPTDTGDIPCFNWYDAVAYCTSLTKGGRSGWHLPTVEQLASLVDKSVSDSPKLPAGHPFIGVSIPNFSCGGFWSATTDAYNVDSAWLVGFNMGTINHGSNFLKTNIRRAWCVRGGQSHDGY